MAGTYAFDTWIHSLWLPFLRISAALMAAPLFSAAHAPAPFRVFLALVLTVILVPLMPALPAVSPLSLGGVLQGANELLIGMAMGFLLQMVFEAVMLGGQLIATGMGLSFATLMDPQQGTPVPVLGQFLVILSTLLFLAMGGHLEFIRVLGDSFRLWPVATTPFNPEAAQVVLGWFSELLRGAVRVALPAMMALLVVQVALGVVSRAAPSLNIFAIGFPLTLLTGFFVLTRLLPTLLDTLSLLLGSAWQAMGQMLAAGGPHVG